MAWLTYNTPSSSIHRCYHAEFGRSALKDVGIQENPQNWGALELRCLGMGGVADPKIHITPTCYHLKFGSSATKLGSAETPPLGVGAWLTNQEQAPSPYVLPRQKWWFCVKGVWINSREPPKLGSAWVPPFTVGKIDDPRNKSLHTCVILSSVVVLDQTVRALLRRSA